MQCLQLHKAWQVPEWPGTDGGELVSVEIAVRARAHTHTHSFI